MIWSLEGSPNQNQIIEAALTRADFPWVSLQPGLRADQGKDTIPVQWADLSRFVTGPTAEGIHAKFVEDEHDHSHGYHVIHARNRALGLAYYSGRVVLDLSLENNHELAGEVFFSEGAHMADFFYMTDDMRTKVFNVFHTGDPDVADAEHGHGWFDVGTYREEVGEAFMGGFIQAFTDYDVTIPFVHVATEEVGRHIREVLIPYFGKNNSPVFHDRHRRVRADVAWPTREAASATGRRPCRICRP